MHYVTTKLNAHSSHMRRRPRSRSVEPREIRTPRERTVRRGEVKTPPQNMRRSRSPPRGDSGRLYHTSSRSVLVHALFPHAPRRLTLLFSEFAVRKVPLGTGVVSPNPPPLPIALLSTSVPPRSGSSVTTLPAVARVPRLQGRYHLRRVHFPYSTTHSADREGVPPKYWKSFPMVPTGALSRYLLHMVAVSLSRPSVCSPRASQGRKGSARSPKKRSPTIPVVVNEYPESPEFVHLFPHRHAPV